VLANADGTLRRVSHVAINGGTHLKSLFYGEIFNTFFMAVSYIIFIYFTWLYMAEQMPQNKTRVSAAVAVQHPTAV